MIDEVEYVCCVCSEIMDEYYKRTGEEEDRMYWCAECWKEYGEKGWWRERVDE